MSQNTNNVSMSYVAWTGGSIPKPLEEINPLERKLVDAMFEMQCAAFRAFWGKEPDKAVCDTYLTRARYDAHATVRDGVTTNIILG